MDRENKLRVLSKYIKSNKGIECEFGHIDIMVADVLGQGGNGIVYLGKINESEVAVKFLVNTDSKKLERFKAEYFNVSIIRENLHNVVNCLHYEVLKIDDVEIPYMIMKKYETSLKKYRKTLKNVEWEEVLRLFNELCTTLDTLERNGIIHRDLKPENILIDDKGNFIVSDFGIAHFDNQKFPIANLTSKGERLANIEFSSPEQISGKNVSYTSDIYSIAQIVYWFVFGEVNRGTGGKYFSEVYDNEEARYLDSLVYKCINNEPEKRYQSAKEISDTFIEMKIKDREINPFDDMHELSQIIRSTIPEAYHSVVFVDDKEDIKKLVEKIAEAKTNREFEFNTGTSNNTIYMFKYLDNGHFLLNQRELNIKGIWALCGDSVYDDILILETAPILPYIIDGEEYYGVAVINNTKIVPVENIYSGYIRYEGKVYNTNELEIEERYIYPIDRDKFLAIGAFHQSSIIEENDKYISGLQNYETLDNETILKLKREIRKNRPYDVAMHL